MPEPVRVPPVGQGVATPDRSQESTSKQRTAQQTSFADLLRAQQGIAPLEPTRSVGAPEVPGLRFSAHAQTRMNSRQITLEAQHVERLQNAVQRAEGKGARDALILMDNMAMVVSIKNRTVVTVVDRDHLKENVFTNIDSAVIA
ncbi:MAG TPA: TIGR02530 family flagellar biosynthesis protein [Chthonomonas sp.]|uniref:TIGR02530 family flagellar biosynthesis protein n=1 Tax=Chthonomonas sp. TaxID=2282153 RepID=UPI002B4B4FEA|nr:TIGR02530 family flagellar biosynthesis protein [Chthonomonas sp.]HLH79187.1 TIGR02530 family flagellar biosynthesis protein [Chthonomonas sp.]